MKIKDRIEFKNKPPVLTFKAHDKVIDAVMVMSEKNYGASVIVDNDHKPVGIITERDFMRRLLAKNLDARTTLISEIMTTDLKLASSDDEVVNWLRIMSNERFRHLPVVDAQGRLLNVMSQGDFVSYTWPQLLGKIKDNVVKSFLEKYQIHMLVGGIMIYSLIVIFVLLSIR
jgi:CBS domain-containing protein